MSIPGVRGLGEVGLDHTSLSSAWSVQHRVLDRALTFLRPDDVLVIHNRAPDNDRSEPMLQLLYQLKGVVPRDQRIHVHCFHGGVETVKLWIETFPNAHFGYTPLVSSASQDAKTALRQMEDHRILLETDAPYFKTKEARFSTPAFLGVAAASVAHIRGQDPETILQLTAANGRRLYRM